MLTFVEEALDGVVVWWSSDPVERNTKSRQTVQSRLDAVESGRNRGSTSDPPSGIPISRDLPPVLQ